MSDHTVNAMKSAARSMREVVIPALDPSHPLAAEQAGLIAKYLEFWADRTNSRGARNAAELRCYLHMGSALQPHAAAISSFLAEHLSAAVERATEVSSRTDHDVTSVQDAVAELTRVITALVRSAAQSNHPAALEVEQVVTAHSREIALLQRAWFGPQGWEDPAPPPLHDVLARILTEKGSTDDQP